MTRGAQTLSLVCAGLALALLGATLAAPAAAGATGTSAGAALLASGGPVSPAPPPLVDLPGPVARAATPDLPIGLGALGALPAPRETAAFAAGRVVVGVVFLESDGSRTPSTEDWSREDPRWPGEDRRGLVVAQVQSAIDWWNARSPDGSLEAFLPAAGAYGAPQTLATGYEPIARAIDYGFGGSRDVCTDAAWRWQAMRRLGFRHDAGDDAPRPESAYADALRRKNDADWAFIVYVVDSLSDGDGAFRNGAIAYTADLFGPYVTLTYDNERYGFANFDAVLAHEMGHVFGALDEYAPPHDGYPSTGDLTSGYLGVRNRNAVRGGTSDLPCIMRGSNATLRAFARGDLCPSTIGQTGLRDSDADTRPDVVDTRPVFRVESRSTATGGRLVVNGTVREQPWPRGSISMGTYFHRGVSIRVPQMLRYRVDGGEWLPLTAVDGGFGAPVERWALITDALTDGHHLLQLEGTSGETAAGTVHLWAGPTPVTLDLAADAGFSRKAVAVAAGRPVRLFVRSTSAGLPVPHLAWVRLVRLADHAVVARLRTGQNGVWTGKLKPARSGVYVARFAGAGQFLGPVISGRMAITVR